MNLPKRKINDFIKRVNSLVRFGLSDFDSLSSIIHEVETLPASNAYEAREKFEVLCALSSFYGDREEVQRYIKKVQQYPYNEKAQATCMLSLMRLGSFQSAGGICNNLSEYSDIEIADDAARIALYTGQLDLFFSRYQSLSRMQKADDLLEYYRGALNIYNFLQQRDISEDTFKSYISTAAETVGLNVRYIAQTGVRFIKNELGLSYIFYVVDAHLSLFQLDLIIIDALLNKYGVTFSEIITFSVERFNPSSNHLNMTSIRELSESKAI